LAARGRGRDRRSREAARSLSRVDACNPLLQAHPTWARDEHEGHGISTSLTPISGHLSSPLRARPRADPSGLGHAATFDSSAQGPPGLETPTLMEASLVSPQERHSFRYGQIDGFYCTVMTPLYRIFRKCSK
jgi:hypothetical protein